MDFTELYRHTSGLVQISPGAQFVLTAVEDRLVVRRTESFQIARTWLVDNSHSPSALVLSGASAQQPKPKAPAVAQEGWITHIGWSSDSEYILAACAKRSVVNVYKLRDEEWTARVEAGVEGLVKAEWAPDGRSILCFSEWGVRRLICVCCHRPTHSSPSAARNHLVACHRHGDVHPISEVPGQGLDVSSGWEVLHPGRASQVERHDRRVRRDGLVQGCSRTFTVSLLSA